jgi:hypothetical protein
LVQLPMGVMLLHPLDSSHAIHDFKLHTAANVLPRQMAERFPCGNRLI